jgi:hypothetical protein
MTKKKKIKNRVIKKQASELKKDVEYYNAHNSLFNNNNLFIGEVKLVINGSYMEHLRHYFILYNN